MNNGQNHIAPNDIPRSDLAEQVESIDWDKLRTVLRKNWPWIIILLILSNASAYLFIRYTKPLYESSSELKLDIKSESDLLGIKNVNDFGNISGEIEILKSRLFFNKLPLFLLPIYRGTS